MEHNSVKRLHYFNLTREYLQKVPDKEIQEMKARKETQRCKKNHAMSESYAMPYIPTANLNNGQKIPVVGLGTWKCERGGQVRDAVECAIRCGYRHIDCAPIYGNEEEVGEALQTIFNEGVVQRKDVWITSKLWNAQHASSDVKSGLLKTLKDLRLEYLDLYLIHWPVTGKHGNKLDPSIKETWQAMEKLVDEGLTKAIGVSNFSHAKLNDMQQYYRITPAVNQIERHPYFRNDKTVEWCEANDIHVSAYSPLGSPDSKLLMKRKLDVNLLTHPLVEEIARRLNKNPGQVLIRWAIDAGKSVLPKSVTPSRIKSNLDVIDWELPLEDYERLSSFQSQVRILNGDHFLSPDGPYQKLSDLWDDPEEDGRLEHFIKGMYKYNARAPVVPLGKDIEMPLLGLGTWRSGPGEIKQSVLTSVHAGYRHIDCAEVYQNEGEVGEALQQIISEGVIQRKDIWITSKLWNSCHSKESVLPAARKTLKSLGLDYLDLYLIHWPVTGNTGPVLLPSLEETWTEMEALVDAGLVRSIGVSNFSSVKLGSILHFARIKPVVNQVECHPYFRNDALLEYCKENGIHMTAYSPLGGAPENEALVKRKLPRLLQDPDVNAIAEKLGKSPAQILIRWAVQHGTCVLPKSSNARRIEENLDVFSWALDAADYSTLSDLNPQVRMLDGSFLLNPKGPYKTIEDLWDE